LFEHDLFPKTGSHFSGSCSGGVSGSNICSCKVRAVNQPDVFEVIRKQASRWRAKAPLLWASRHL